MYKCYQRGIVFGKESFPWIGIIGENILFVLLWVVAGYLLWPVWMPYGIPVITILWGVLVVLIQILLKKHNCSGCYYYGKRCHLGWGKIAALLFKQDSGDPGVGMKWSLFYVVSPPVVFIASLVFALLFHPSGAYWAVLSLYLLLNMASLPVRKSGCRYCAMRSVCPGSAVKEKKR